MKELSVGTTIARACADRVGRMLAATFFLLARVMAAPMLARGAKPAANIDQCRNGQITAPVQCIDNAWQNGNLGSGNSHYREGDSVPFRAVLTDLNASAGNTHTLVIQYDTLQQGTHAYDYLTSFNATEKNADPVHDISGTTAGNCFPIPVDLTITFANPGSSQEPGCIQIYNGTITSVAYGSADMSGQRSVTVTFTAPAGAPVGGAVTSTAGQAVSAAFTPLAVGHYCFRGEYTPDAFAPYSPSHETNLTTECFNVVPPTTTLTTNAGGPYDLGVNGTVALSDIAHLSGGTSNATGDRKSVV